VRRTAWAVAALAACLLSGCDDDTSSGAGVREQDRPFDAPTTPRGLTAGLLRHVDRHVVREYAGGYQKVTDDYEGWTAEVELDGDPRTVYVFIQRFPRSFDPGCQPDAPDYVELSCHKAANGADRSLMQRDDNAKEPPGPGVDATDTPILQGRTRREDGASVLVEVFGDQVTDETKALVLELLDDEALGAITTEELNAAGTELDDYHELSFGASVGKAPES
jgi:hypothetical protein